MPGPVVTVELNAADAELVRAWQEARRGPEGMKTELDRLKGKAGEAKRTTDGFATSVVSGLKMAAGAVFGFSSAFGAVSAAIRAANQEYQEFLDRQKRASELQVSAAGVLRNMIFNRPSDISAEELIKEWKDVSRDTGADVVVAGGAMSHVVSAKGNVLGSKRAIRTLRAALRLNPSFSQQEAEVISGAAVDIQKAFGTTNEEDALGALSEAHRISRVVDPAAFSEHGVNAIAQLHGFGDDFKHAAALFGTVTTRSFDVTGQTSKTALVMLAKQLETLTAGVKELKGKGLSARLDWVASDDKRAAWIRHKLLGAMDAEAAAGGAFGNPELHTRATAFTAIRGLVTPGSAERLEYENALANTHDLSQGHVHYQELLTDQAKVGALSAVRNVEAGRAAEQQQQLDETRGRRGSAKEALEKELKEVGVFGSNWLEAAPGIGRRARELSEFDFRTGVGLESPEVVAAAIARRRLEEGLREGDDASAEGMTTSKSLRNFAEKYEALGKQHGARPDADQIRGMLKGMLIPLGSIGTEEGTAGLPVGGRGGHDFVSDELYSYDRRMLAGESPEQAARHVLEMRMKGGAADVAGNQMFAPLVASLGEMIKKLEQIEKNTADKGVVIEADRSTPAPRQAPPASPTGALNAAH